MAYMSHGRANAESLLDFMDSRRRPTSEILTIFLGQPTLAESGGGCRILVCILEFGDCCNISEMMNKRYLYL